MKKKRWLWEFYFIFFAAGTLNQAINIFIPDSTIYTFHHILIAFDRWLAVLYFVRIFCELLNMANLIPLFLFTFDLHWMDKKFWQWLVITRITFDMVGHYYEFVTLKSLYFSNTAHAVHFISWIILTTLPSYFACITYAFGKKEPDPLF